MLKTLTGMPHPRLVGPGQAASQGPGRETSGVREAGPRGAGRSSHQGRVLRAERVLRAGPRMRTRRSQQELGRGR